MMIRSAVLLLVSAVLVYSLYYTVRMISYTGDDPRKNSRDYSYHVAVVGEYNNSVILNQICRGALSLSDEYNVVIDNLVPKTGAGTMKLQTLVDYAASMSVDGIIAYIPDERVNVNSPVTVDGKRIPVIMIGNDNPETQAVSYIGINSYELGKKMAETLALFVPDGGKVLAVYDSSSTAALYGRILSSLRETVVGTGSFRIENTDVRKRGGISAEDEIRDAIRFQPDIRAVICLSSDNTVRVAENIVDLNLAGKITVIGFGETPQTKEFLNKGILSAIISQQPEDMGRQAVRSLFEYITTGNTNDYTTVTVRVITGKKHGSA